MSDESIADDIIRAGYDRWKRLEEEKAAIGDDLKELFAELKGQGFAPKALRESFRRVRNINDASQQEHDAIVDLYVAALTGARPARTREELPAHDPETGEIDDKAETPNEAAHTSHVGAARQAEEEVRASSAAIPEHLATVSTDPLRSGAGTHMDAVPVAHVAEVGIPASAQIAEPQPTAAQTEGPSSLPTSVAGPEAVESPAANSEAGIPVSASEPVGAPSADADDRDASLASSHTGVPVVTNNVSAPRPEGCERPSACGSSSWRRRCFRCQRAWDAAHGHPPEAVA